MGETATNTMPPKGFGTVDFWKDLGKGAFIAVITNILLGIYAIVQTNQFPSSEEWATMIKSTLAILIAYFIKNLGTNNVGQMFTADKPTVTVGAKELDKVIDKAAETNQ